MPMDFPDFVKNQQTVTQVVDITPPTFDDNADHSKTTEAILVEQQWRDADAAKLGERHPLSLNRDAAQVVDDPYTA